MLSDFIDMTKYRLNTHVGNAVEKGGPRGIMHLPSKPAFSEPLRVVLKAHLSFFLTPPLKPKKKFNNHINGRYRCFTS